MLALNCLRVIICVSDGHGQYSPDISECVLESNMLGCALEVHIISTTREMEFLSDKYSDSL